MFFRKVVLFGMFAPAKSDVCAVKFSRNYKKTADVSKNINFFRISTANLKSAYQNYSMCKFLGLWLKE